ncbi:MAG: hypothetical protein JWM53_5687, partial [bacterium]|nr:hypothetical protein [bacterium]
MRPGRRAPATLTACYCAAGLRVAIQRFLSRPTATWAAIALAVALVAPSLTIGLCADDWLQLLVARGLHPFGGLPASRLDLFSFVGHDARDTLLQMNAGVLPWWTDPEVKLAFWRPLSSLTHLADWTLWPRSPMAMHAHSLAWFALALVAVAALYRRLFVAFGGSGDSGSGESGSSAGGVPWAAGLATLLYAVDDAHGPAVGWIANRNAMVAVAAALPVLLLHDRWRRDGWRAGAWVAPLWLAVALGAGESALAVTAYLFAYALCLDRGAWRSRALSLAPYVAVVVVWRVVYHALGFGTAYSGVYLDPGAEPLAFLSAMPSRALFLLAGQLFTPWSDLAALWPFVSPHAERNALIFATVVVALFVALLSPLCRRDRLARFFAVGALAAVVPVCSTFPADRLLWFVGVGAMGLIARWLELRPRAWWAAIVAALLVVIHVVAAAPLLAVRSRSMQTVAKPLRRADASIPASETVRDGMLVLVNPPSDVFVAYIVILRASEGRALPPTRWLATGTTAVEITRVDEQSLRVAPDQGFIPFISERMLRRLDRPF